MGSLADHLHDLEIDQWLDKAANRIKKLEAALEELAEGNIPASEIQNFAKDSLLDHDHET